MAATEAIEQWSRAQAIGLHPQANRGYGVPETPSSAVARVAWLGRTSTYDQQDPTLSLPRQLKNCVAALPGEAVIVAHFYDIESGRKDLKLRGHSTAHEAFDLDIPRDGGVADLLLEAASAQRHFDIVICESIDRIARRAYFGNEIEHRLENFGVKLLASDEPIRLSTSRREKRATNILTRRVKQGVTE